MADPTLVNGQITDAITQANVKILAEAPAQALGTVYQVMAQATGIGMQNAATAQQQMTTLGAAATTQGVNLLYTMDPAADAVSTQQILSGNSLAQELISLNAAVAGNQQAVRIPQVQRSGGGGQPVGSGQPPQLPLQPSGR
ncbi:MAG TPA: RebB family R body protein [Thermoanaerobaculia bacterium]|nr:RebB family R body protein [Thermoanaerobaculia bacterium]